MNERNTSVMESKTKYAICPTCDKPVDHLVNHLKKIHEWEVVDILDVMEGKLMTDGRKDAVVAAAVSREELRRVALDDSNFVTQPSKLELEVEGEAKRAVDMALMMRALTDMNVAVGAVYKRIESDIQDIASEAHGKYIFAGRDVIDGPRRDRMKHLRDILVPSSEHLRECVTHELCRISNVLKDDIASLL